jgi:hypothetical protein
VQRLRECAADDHPEGVIAGVGDVDVAAGADRHGGGVVERGGGGARPSPETSDRRVEPRSAQGKIR